MIRRHFLYLLLLLQLCIETYQWPFSYWWSGTSSKSQLPVHKAISAAANSLFPRVLNFFPEPVAEDCISSDKRRRGVCMNTYDCQERRGHASGSCALGFGTCCIFITDCSGEVQNNMTYITNPGFPNLVDHPMNCSILVKKVDQQISQLRIDFHHFNIGQPNRKTGVCDDDIMVVRSGERTLHLCGWNSGQHIYVDIGEEPVTINFRLPGSMTSRMWEMSVQQLGFEQRAPAGCLQYARSVNGTLRTLNYLPNGRYLANYDYLICIRQEYGMCSIAYEPCGRDSFRIGSSRRLRNATTLQQITTEAPSIFDFDYEGSGASAEQQFSAVGSSDGSATKKCRDRILIPCDFEEFITPGNDGTGICDLEHCGISFCPMTTSTTTKQRPQTTSSENGPNCRVETSALPFHIRVDFGPAGVETAATPPEDMTGMCLSYEQIPCAS
ncbi:uncharacterized protein LOC106649735 [Trichogramma pretiosum]|uniref:uncharacterized protein LOC106649735 n=1 Tax=Trichogramma pretiosum TaxID=7493 RepID=UPI0006C9C5EB|nr:uncharacterized protein LOC106649735 [Trichogramma pretiosum]